MKMRTIFLPIFTILFLLECEPIQAWRRRRRRCNRTPCSWRWSDCSTTCGNGVRSPSVTKRQGRCGSCTLPKPESCSSSICPVHCEWSEWGAWGSCPVSCGGGTRVRTINHSPPASNGGQQCKGLLQDVSSCNVQCCPINCKWNEWGSFGPCSVSCGIGTQTRSRSVEIVGSCGGTECLGMSSSSRQCTKSCCPVDCVWNNWTEFGSCSVTCGPGLKERARSIKINSQCGGISCLGKSHEGTACKSQECPINCMWSEWTNWRQCSKSCGGGSQSRSRIISTSAQYGGRDCGEDSKQSRDCNTHCCKVDCEWGEWSTWNSCSRSCGGGTRTRARVISVEEICNGNKCDGEDKESENCNQHCCAVDCKVSEWNVWSSCTETCGMNGISIRKRNIIEQAKCGGHQCSGNLQETKQCNVACLNGGIVDITNNRCNCGNTWKGECCEEDIDECKENVAICTENSKCVNEKGNYRCVCLDGYYQNGLFCDDINECDTDSHNCHSWATCMNKPGSFTCRCPEGFIGNGKFCENINECKRNTSKCDENAHCIDKNGTHECVCMKGYEGNGINCTDLNDCSRKEETCANSNTGVVDQISGLFYQNIVASIFLIIGGFMVFTFLVISVYRCSTNKTRNQDYATHGGDEHQGEIDASGNVNEVSDENIYDEVPDATNTEENFNEDLFAHIRGVVGEVVNEENLYDEVPAANSINNSAPVLHNLLQEAQAEFATTSKTVSEETHVTRATNLEAGENMYQDTQAINTTTFKAVAEENVYEISPGPSSTNLQAFVEDNLYEEAQAINTTTFKAVAEENVYEVSPAPSSTNLQAFVEDNLYENLVVSNNRL